MELMEIAGINFYRPDAILVLNQHLTVSKHWRGYFVIIIWGSRSVSLPDRDCMDY